MLIFLPPSEGKTPPREGAAPVALDALTLPDLEEQRRTVMDALIRVSRQQDAQKVLKVGARVMEEVARNEELWQAPAAPAHEIYSGVLFDALGASELPPVAASRAAEQVLIFSGLFGAISFADRIPAYRLSMGVDLSPTDGSPAPGRLGSYWRRALDEPLRDLIGDQLVLDCRSSSYAAAFRSDPQQTVVVNSFTEREGERKVVTHFAKHARGVLSGMALRAEHQPRHVDDVAELASTRWQVEVRPATGRTPHQLDLIDQG
ncbi:YaaA family protein [Nesterenkonia suensis]